MELSKICFLCWAMFQGFDYNDHIAQSPIVSYLQSNSFEGAERPLSFNYSRKMKGLKAQLHL